MIFEILITRIKISSSLAVWRVWREKTGLEMSLRRLRTYVDRMALAGDLVSRRDNHFSFHMSTITTVSPRVR